LPDRQREKRQRPEHDARDPNVVRDRLWLEKRSDNREAENNGDILE
jgi:hypothetical protein